MSIDQPPVAFGHEHSQVPEHSQVRRQSIQLRDINTSFVAGIHDLLTRPNEEGDDGLPPTKRLLACTETYESIEALDSAIDSIPPHCQSMYTVDTLSRSLKSALQNYTDLMEDGYDGKFKTYAQSVSDSADETLHDFVINNGDKYFTCIIPGASVCCDYCKDGAHPADQCRYCFEGECNLKKRETAGIAWGSTREGQTPDLPTPKIVFGNRTEPCPPDYSQRGYGSDNPYQQSVYWSFKDDKEADFYAELMTSTAIAKDKTKVGNYNRGLNCAPSTQLGDGDECWNTGMDFSIPVIDGYSSSDVSNPKDLFNNGIKNVSGISDQLEGILLDLKSSSFTGDAEDLIDSLSLPILMILEATESMATIETVADKIDEEKKKAIILGVIGAILFFIPVVGELAGALAEVSSLAGIITALGVAGNAAMDIYTIVDDPENAPLAIFSLILEPLALTSVATVARTADIRRAMSDADIAKLGPRISQRMRTIRKIVGVCRKV